MFEINMVIMLFLFCLLSFFDFIVFNEEVLLALCFLSFLFYCFNNLSESVAATFDARASKFEDELLTTFANSKNLLSIEFDNRIKIKNFILKFEILMSAIVNYLTMSSDFISYRSN